MATSTNAFFLLRGIGSRVAGTVLVSAVVGFLLAALAFGNSDPVIAF